MCFFRRDGKALVAGKSPGANMNPQHLVLSAHPSLKTELIPGLEKAVQWDLKTSSPSITLSLLCWGLAGGVGQPDLFLLINFIEFVHWVTVPPSGFVWSSAGFPTDEKDPF